MTLEGAGRIHGPTSLILRGAMLLCLGLQLSWSQDTTEVSFTEITHEKPKDGLWNLEFDTEGYKLLERGKQKIVARGRFDSVLVGFQLTFESNFNFYKDTTKEPDGFVTIAHIGEESDNLARALHKIMGKEDSRSRFRALVKYPVTSTKGWNSDFRSGRIEFLLKGKSSSPSDYFEILLVVHKDKQTVWIRELKKAYRDPFLQAISQ